MVTQAIAREVVASRKCGAAYAPNKQEFLEQKNDEQAAELERLRENLQREKSKTWFDKLRGK